MESLKNKDTMETMIEKNKRLGIEIRNISEENSDLKAENAEMKAQNIYLKAEIKKLEDKLAKNDAIVMSYANDLQTREIAKDIWKMQSPLAHSASDVERSTRWYENRHQSDCIRINELTVTLDTLVDRYANLRKIHGLN